VAIHILKATSVQRHVLKYIKTWEGFLICKKISECILPTAHIMRAATVVNSKM